MSTAVNQPVYGNNANFQNMANPECRNNNSSQFHSNDVKKNPTASQSLSKRQPALPSRQVADVTSGQRGSSKVPACLIRLVRSIVRTFYSREHSLIVDMLVRNTIMKEDDLCERLRFERKQLRQYLHTLKSDQFIKSKLQLETDSDGKTTKITHYFIDYKLFVNVVKYRLDQMQRRLESEQRQSTSRATFKCISCNTTYTDLEVDRLMDFTNPGKLMCVYCRAEVAEEEDNVSRTDARALIAKFHHQVRDPIDLMLRKCDEIHLSPSILEPEIRPLEPLTDEYIGGIAQHKVDSDVNLSNGAKRDAAVFGPTENSVRIVLSEDSDKPVQTVKEHPIWMADSTISLESNAFANNDQTPISSTDTFNSYTQPSDSITQTLTPGRVPSSSTSARLMSDGNTEINATAAPCTPSGDIMQLLLVHERRGPPSQNLVKNSSNSGRNVNPRTTIYSKTLDTSNDNPENRDSIIQTNQKFEVKVGERMMSYVEIDPTTVKNMTPEERAEYIRVGKLVYSTMMLE